MTHFADRLASASRAKRNSLCVGLDPRWESLPEEIRHRHAPDSLGAVARAYEEFCSRVIDIVAPLTPVVKPQSAFFEACGPEGMTALQRVLTKARQRGLITILDGKRNDIASTASAYADASLDGVRFAESQEGRELRVESREPALDSPLSALRTWLHPVWDADALTVNPYLGRDAVEPFLESARRSGRGIFVLVRTSNPGAGQFQDLLCEEPIVKSGEARAGSSLSALHSPLSPLASPLYVHVAEAVGKWSRENLGQCGLGDVGAVVGATKSRESRVESGELRVPSAESRESREPRVQRQELALDSRLSALSPLGSSLSALHSPLSTLRTLIPEVPFLVPGFGSQGGAAQDVAAAFRDDGLGAIINSSRGIIFSFKPSDPKWELAVEAAARETIASLAQNTPMKRLEVVSGEW